MNTEYYLQNNVSKRALYILYAVMIPFAAFTVYVLLNAGNPDSLLRAIIPNPGYDVYVALLCSFLIFVVGFVVFNARNREEFGELIERNAVRIRTLRKKGNRDEEIADSILAALQINRKGRYKMARKKLIAYLSDFE